MGTNVGSTILVDQIMASVFDALAGDPSFDEPTLACLRSLAESHDLVDSNKVISALSSN